jgi:hypothetical protein
VVVDQDLPVAAARSDHAASFVADRHDRREFAGTFRAARPSATSSAQGPPVKWYRLMPAYIRPSIPRTAAPIV